MTGGSLESTSLYLIKTRPTSSNIDGDKYAPKVLIPYNINETLTLSHRTTSTSPFNISDRIWHPCHLHSSTYKLQVSKPLLILLCRNYQKILKFHIFSFVESTIWVNLQFWNHFLHITEKHNVAETRDETIFNFIL